MSGDLVAIVRNFSFKRDPTFTETVDTARETFANLNKNWR